MKDALKSAAKFAGKMIENHAEHTRKVNTLTDRLMRETYGVDREAAEKIATALVIHAEEITWK